MIILQVFFAVIFVFLAFNVCYILVFAVAGHFRKTIDYQPADRKNRIAVMIPAYKEDTVILETARQAVAHDYPSAYFDVFIIADQLKAGTITKLSALPLRVIEVQFEKSTKARSLKFALQQLPPDDYEMIFILDADNIMEAGCLEKANAAYERGFRMIQLHRCAKNLNTTTAILDAVSEEINNHIFRQGHRAMRLTASVIGSGMAFDFHEFKRIMMETDIENNPGEDRQLCQEMFMKGFVCEYIDDARVMDEKVQSGSVIEVQRTRWISAQLNYAYESWVRDFRKVFSHGIHYFDFALQSLILPRVLLVFFVGAFFAVSLLVHFLWKATLFPGVIYWGVLFALCVLALVLSVIGRIAFSKLMKASVNLPATFFSVFKALMKSRRSHDEFIATPKEFSEEI